MKKYNVIWIVVDRVRNYRSGLDDADRLDIMDDFAKDSVEFTNAITSAPSSMLSASTMFTGLSACIISRHFNDWQFDEKRISSLPRVLMEKGYPVYSIFSSGEERRALQNLVFPLSNKYFPRGISHKDWWTNKEITNILENLLNKVDKKSPALYIIWFDAREDPNTSKEVARALDLFKKHNLYDNSIIVMCSDHGYPDASAGLTGKTMKKLTHDMIVTDDNIRVPMLLKYPGCKKGLKVSNVVGTIDVFPTICDILGLPAQNEKFKYRGSSMLDVINKKAPKNKVVRTDTRLNLANGRITSLRSERYKYVYYWDRKKEELYDLQEDEYETKNIFSKKMPPSMKKMLHDFRDIKDRMEKDVNKFHVFVLEKNITAAMEKTYPGSRKEGVSRILMTTRGAPKIMIEIFLNSMKKVFPNAKVELLATSADHEEYKDVKFDNLYFPEKMNVEEAKGLGITNNKYDLIFYLTENSRFVFIDNNIIKLIKMLKPKNSFMLDYNFEFYNRFLSKWIVPIGRYMNRNSQYYKEEPTLLLRDLCALVKSGIKHNIMKERQNPIEADKVKRVRDRVIKTKKK